MSDSFLEEALFGSNVFGGARLGPNNGPLADRFTISPFSILDTRNRTWLRRKRAWLALGIEGEVSREKTLRTSTVMEGKRSEYSGGSIWQGDTASVFDPVLCECMYKWFSPELGQVIDPFAGGAVRGVVAGMMKRNYWGCDLRKEQIDANGEQSTKIQPLIKPVWVLGDAINSLPNAPEADFIFSCPPYGNLEVYSKDPLDLSTMSHDDFLTNYKQIIQLSCARLKQDRFACFVVGDFRDKHGFYRDFVSTTISNFYDSGLELYNEAILINSVGSACMRITKQFEAGRKLAKLHQNVLVFCKGDGKKATKFITGAK